MMVREQWKENIKDKGHGTTNSEQRAVDIGKKTRDMETRDSVQ